MPGEPGKLHVYENAPQEPFNKASVSLLQCCSHPGPSRVTHREPPGVCICNSSPRDWGAFPQLRNMLRPHRMHTQHSDPINETFPTLLPTSGDSLEITDSVINQKATSLAVTTNRRTQGLTSQRHYGDIQKMTPHERTNRKCGSANTERDKNQVHSPLASQADDRRLA